MRFIHRYSWRIPSILDSSLARQWQLDVADHYRLSEGQRSRRRAPVPTSVLENSDLHEALHRLQKGKCAYCESMLEEMGYVLEHYRPLSNAAGLNGQVDSPDHYGWFALEWRNLMLLCIACSKVKQNYFPILRDRVPPLASWREAVSERPLILNPFTIRPERHIGFDRKGKAYPLSPIGEHTVELLNLNREHLRRSRARVIREVDQIIRAVASDSRIDQLIGPDAPHSGAAAIYAKKHLEELGVHLPGRRELWREVLAFVMNPQEHGQGLANESMRPNNPASREHIVPASLRHIRRDENAIVRIRISAFKGISELALRLPRWSTTERAPSMMLLGENASGKTSILQAVALCLAGIEDQAALGLQRDAYKTRSPTDWQSVSRDNPQVELTFSDKTTHIFEWTGRSLRTVRRESSEAVPSVWAYGAHRRLGNESDPMPAIVSLFEPDKALPNPKGWLAEIDDHQFNAVARALRVILALKKYDDIERVRGEVYVRTQGRVTPIEQLSDGYKSLFAMVADVMRGLLTRRTNLEYAGGVVLIDEIESHLHPRWKMRVVAALRDALPGVQFIFTTHDPLCLRGMHKGEVVVIYRDESGELCAMSDLPDVSTLRVDQLLTSDFFGLNSATDPAIDRITAELATLAAIPDEAISVTQRTRRDELLNEFPGMTTIGSDVGRQIAAEALTRHVNDDQRDLTLRADARRDSIRRILDVLNEETFGK